MLVLTRRIGERIQIGDDIVITVARIGPDAVRLGIDAPKDVNIVREELVPVDGIQVRSIDEIGRR